MKPAMRARRATVRDLRRANRPELTERRRIALLKTTLRRPRSLGTYCLAAGIPGEDAQAVCAGLRAAAKRLDVQPATRAVTSRQIGSQGFRSPSRQVARWTRNQVLRLIPAYRPRKPEYIAAVSALLTAISA